MVPMRGGPYRRAPIIIIIWISNRDIARKYMYAMSQAGRKDWMQPYYDSPMDFGSRLTLIRV